MAEYNLANHPDDDHEHREALAPCKRCGATPGGAEHNCFGLKPMSIAPLRTILAVHYEIGPMEIKPNHEANFWLPGTHWFDVDDSERPSMDEEEFDGWLFESAE